MMRRLFYLLRWSHLALIWRDLIRLPEPVHSGHKHLRATISWLEQAQDAVSGGVSAGYDLTRGWLPPYPETTGYIITTFLHAAKALNEDKLIDRAVQLGDWEISIQLPSGAVRGGVGVNDYPIVFNTGQVMEGWLALYQHTQSQRFLDAAKRAGDWLISIQDDSGRWDKFDYNDIAHTYSSRVAWPLLWLGQMSNQDKYSNAGSRNIQWVLSQTTSNGWIGQMGFTKSEHDVLTHPLAYTLEGLIEASQFLDTQTSQRILALVYQAGERLMHLYERNKPHPYAIPHYMPATIAPGWKAGNYTYTCLTGNAQIALVWLKLYQISKDVRLLNSAIKMLDQLKKLHILKHSLAGIQGGIAGSFPIWGEYMRWRYPNWAAKFFADAMMLQEDLLMTL